MRQDDDRRGRHVVAALNLQLVLVTRYRRGVLTGERLGTLGEVFARVCADFGAELVAMDGVDDHVHLERYRVRTHREHLWPRSWFAASAGGALPETLRAYIRPQRTPDRPG